MSEPLQQHFTPIVLEQGQLEALQASMQRICDTNNQLITAGQQTANRVRTVTDLVKRTTECDGSSYQSLKTWFQEIEYTSHYSQYNEDRIEVAVKTAKGELRREIESFLTQWSTAAATQANPNVPRFSTPWEELKQHLYTTFIPLDEEASLREKVRKIRQSPSESVALFNRRFKGIVEEAYPVALRNRDQQTILLTAYLTSLNSMEIRRPVVHANPTTIDEAMFKAVQVELAEKRLNNMTPQLSTEEPMDISAISTKSQTPLTEQKITEIIDERLAALSIASISDKNKPYSYSNRQKGQTHKNHRYTNPLAWTPEGQPICYECGKPNHIAKQCLVRANRMARGQQTFDPRHNTYHRRNFQRSNPSPNPFHYQDTQTNNLSFKPYNSHSHLN